ncbi:meiotically up-regulated 65 protein [Ophiostoma piceae UAMH 11346]|uniref:Meiotically up-regulated 65 protein n=1 Tax=Ophiostoma piceae (strain UAMH 11346) TaxID=1262450 RepID=S3BZT1_OPHP1|nr:meiotically up-regulated 65 protein [Ophiostoma piceae UAMH 11346]
MPRIKPKSSRRAPPLKDEDYDHEISLVDNSPACDADFDDAGPEDVGSDTDRSASPAPRVSASHSVDETGDGAADSEGNAEPGEPGGSRRQSSLVAPPAIGDAALSPAVTASSATPLLSNTLSTFPTAVAGPSRSRSSSRGRQPRRYGSISSVAAAPLDSAPTVEVHDATPIHEYPTGGSAHGEQPEQSSRRKKGLSVEVTHLPISQQPTRQSMLSVRREPEAAIDVLYENERGLFLCGIPLFSRQALGNLDPSPWTNSVHGSSPTDITTAQVPDPTWEWAWPEWRVNHDDGVDEDGWQYSFMFAKCFAWHGPSWYRSFVRRRAWIRKRVKRTSAASVSLAAASLGLGHIDSITDPTLLNADYFTVVSAATMRRSSSRSGSRMGSRLSLAAPSVGEASAKTSTCIHKTSSGASGDTVNGEGSYLGEDAYAEDGDFFEMPKEITDSDVLMQFLRAARIDREKVEAVDNFIQNSGEDLVRLQDFMHEIMALFVFQASRRALLTHLITAHDAAVQARQAAIDAEEQKANSKAADPAPDTGNDTAHKLQALGRRMGYLTAAVKHADEEVRRLEYWSDIKAMARQGSAQGAVDQAEGWDAQKWQGVDQSGPEPPPTREPMHDETAKP